MLRCSLALLVLIAPLTACKSGPANRTAVERPEAWSSSGTPLVRPALEAERRARLEADLASARAAYKADTQSEDAAIWPGRRLGYLGRFEDAVAAFSRGLEVHPDSYKLLRHRGHRYITLRRFDEAAADLSRAARLVEGVPDEIEPDGAPNRLNLPRSTSHSNIFYHLGLVHFLRGEFEAAERAYERCLEFSGNDDMLVATAHWLYMTRRRMGKEQEAAAILERIRPEMDIIENGAYHRLLLMYKGELGPEELLGAPGGGAVDDSTVGFGVGNWYLSIGDRAKARRVFERVVSGPSWPAFGHIAAEAELARLAADRPRPR
jgi:tetratricopeptide (TPR) repeat protein